MGRLISSVRAGHDAFVANWRTYKEKQEEAVVAAYLERAEKRNGILQDEYAKLNGNDQHFLKHFTDELTSDSRPAPADVTRMVEIVSKWPIEAQKIVAKEFVAKCGLLLLSPKFMKWANGLPAK